MFWGTIFSYGAGRKINQLYIEDMPTCIKSAIVFQSTALSPILFGYWIVRDTHKLDKNDHFEKAYNKKTCSEYIFS